MKPGKVEKVSRIGKYDVLDVLGKGGMGVVYKATDPAIGRLVAIKVITTGFTDDPAFLKRFYREAQSTGKLQHQNIVIVYELGEHEATPFLVMEFLEGDSLQSYISTRRQMSLIDKLGVMIQACNGLHYAHRHNIIHRDIKPANLMVRKDGMIKIVDFGIARIGDETMTLPGQVVGSMNYMSPEQIQGVKVDCRTDIFSTAVVLFELLTYTLPFEGKDAGSTLLKIVNEPAPPLRQFLENYPEDLDYILHRALAKSREDRYETAEEFGFELTHVQEQLRRDMGGSNLRKSSGLTGRTVRRTPSSRTCSASSRTSNEASRFDSCARKLRKLWQIIVQILRSNIWTRQSFWMRKAMSSEGGARKRLQRRIATRGARMLFVGRSRRNGPANLKKRWPRSRKHWIWSQTTPKPWHCEQLSRERSTNATVNTIFRSFLTKRNKKFHPAVLPMHSRH